MCIAGSVVSCTGIVLSIFAPNVPVLMLTYGVIGGFGLGLIYLPAVVAVGYYFEERRALATGRQTMMREGQNNSRVALTRLRIAIIIFG